MSRPPIPAEIRRAVLVEAGHRCAIPRCGSTQIDLHHIVPWESCRKHEYQNLIAICPNCHRRVHSGEIDRKSLQMYKELLADELLKVRPGEFSAPIVEIRRCLTERKAGVQDFAPGYDFAFEYPEFEEPAARVVSKNIEAWGNELLLEYQQRHSRPDERCAFSGTPYYLRGRYEVLRHDTAVISLRYDLEQMVPGAAHRSTTRTGHNFLVDPFEPVTIHELASTPAALNALSELCRTSLLEQADLPLDPEHVAAGTTPTAENYNLFEIHRYGLRFVFEEYQVASYAAGPQFVDLAYESLEGIVNEDVLSRVPYAEEF